MIRFIWPMLLACAFAVGIAALAPSPARAAERDTYRPPSLPDIQDKPTPTHPEPRGMSLRYMDLAVLAGGLILAAVLVLWLRRRWAILLLLVAALLYFGFYRLGCVCPIGGIQNVSLSAVDPTYTISIVVTGIFLLPIIATLLFGRVFCGSVCPLGAAQDVMLRRPIRVPMLLDKTLRWGRWLYLGAAVYFAIGGLTLLGRDLTVQRDFLICKYDPFVNIFRSFNIDAAAAGDWLNVFAFAGPWWIWIVTATLLGSAVFVGRPYCRWLCPYGAILGTCSRVSWKKVTVQPRDCCDCKLCDDACPFGAIENHQAVRSSCLACGRCYTACPKEREHRGMAVSRPAVELLPAPTPQASRPAAAAAATLGERSPIRGRRLVPIDDDSLDLSYLDSLIAANRGDGAVALPILQAIQTRHKYLPHAALERVVELTDLSMAQLVGLATFYNQFRLAPVGKHLVKVCCGTACHVAGATRISEAIKLYLNIRGEADTDALRQFTIQEVACVGCCSLAPVVQVDEVTFGHLSPESAAKAIETFTAASHKRHAEPPHEHDLNVPEDRLHKGASA